MPGWFHGEASMAVGMPSETLVPSTCPMFHIFFITWPKAVSIRSPRNPHWQATSFSMSESIEERFKRAVWLIRNGPKMDSSNEQKLTFYSYFKQARFSRMLDRRHAGAMCRISVRLQAVCICSTHTSIIVLPVLGQSIQLCQSCESHACAHIGGQQHPDGS